MLISFNFQKKDWFIVIGIIIYLLEIFPKFEKKYFRAKKRNRYYEKSWNEKKACYFHIYC